MSRKFIILFLLCSYLFCQKESWPTTRFEKSWLSKFHKMTFRKPFTFMPYNVKVGYYQYGGNNYWNQWIDVLSGDEMLQSNPIELIEPKVFTALSDKNSRKMYSVELNFLKYNFFHKKQNIIDIQLGLGLKLLKAFNTTNQNFDGITFQFKPTIKEYNINCTLLLQWEQQRYYHAFYSIGYVDADLFKTSTIGNIDGYGFNYSMGIGINFIQPRYLKNSDTHHGLEVRFDRLNIEKINDPSNIVEQFTAKQIGILYSFGIGYGGKSTLGDKAYNDLINDDFITAVEKFKRFEKINTVTKRDKDIKEMIEFSKEQIPYQMYDNSIREYEDGNLDQALWWLNKAKITQSEYLIDKIKKQKIIIITQLLQSDLSDKSLDKQLLALKSIKKYDDDNIELNNKIADLLIKKANSLVDRSMFYAAYSLYEESLILDPTKDKVVRVRLNEMTTPILNSVYIFLQSNDNVIAYELLSLIREYSDNNDISNSLFKIASNRLDEENTIDIRDRIQNILYNNQEFSIKNKSDIKLGDQYSEVINILGQPQEKIERRKFDNFYELLTFEINETKYKFFFKNKILIDVERII